MLTGMSAFSNLAARICDLPEGHSLAGADFAGRLDGLSQAHPDRPEWRRSIADLLKVLGMDASYGARKGLALELGYTQDLVDTEGAAAMNFWLHAEVMRRLAADGAKVPEELSADHRPLH